MRQSGDPFLEAGFTSLCFEEVYLVQADLIVELSTFTFDSVVRLLGSFDDENHTVLWDLILWPYDLPFWLLFLHLQRKFWQV